MGMMHTSPHPQFLRRTVFAAFLEVVKIDLIVVPVAFVAATVFWIVGLGSQLPYSVIPEWAFALWAAVSGLSVSTLGFDFSLAPSLVTLGLWFLVAAAVRRLIAGCAAGGADDGEDVPGDWWKAAAAALATFVLAYAGPLLALAVLVGEATVTPLGFGRLFLFLVSSVAFGFFRARGIGDIPGLRVIDDEIWDIGTRLVRRLLWGALAASLIVLAAGLVLRRHDVAESLQVYSSPVAAGVGLLIVQLLFAPGILYSVLSWSAGTGVGLGGSASSSAFHSTTSPLPDVPVLQLLTGDYPAWTVAAPAVLILLGLLSTILGRARAAEVREGAWTGIGVAAVLVFVCFEVLALFSSGALGPLGLANFGPSPLTSAVAVTVWIGVGMALGLLLIRLSALQAEPQDDDSVFFGEDAEGHGDDSARFGEDEPR